MRSGQPGQREGARPPPAATWKVSSGERGRGWPRVRRLPACLPRPRPAARAPSAPALSSPSAFPSFAPSALRFAARPWAPPQRGGCGAPGPPAHPTPARTNPRVSEEPTPEAESRGLHACGVSPRKFENAKRKAPAGLVSPRRGNFHCYLGITRPKGRPVFVKQTIFIKVSWTKGNTALPFMDTEN